MIRSPYDGFSRTGLRRVVAIVLAFDLVAVTHFILEIGGDAVAHPLAPKPLLALSSAPAAVLLLAFSCAACIVRFALGARRTWSGLFVLGALLVLVETDAALRGGAQRFLFFGGATLLGWLAGLFFARALGEREDGAAEAYAEQGAVSVLAACYLGALSSKLGGGGLEWADGVSLRLTVLAQHDSGRSRVLDAYATLVGGSPAVGEALAWLTLLCQASAILLPFGPRPRAVAAALLIAFHLNVWLLTPILFLPSMVLLAAFGFPWPRWLGHLRRYPTSRSPSLEGAPASIQVRQLFAPLALSLLATGFLALVAWRHPFFAFTQARHYEPALGADSQPSTKPPRGTPADPPPIPPLPTWALPAQSALAPGTEFAGLRVSSLAGSGDGALIVSLHGSGGHFRVRVVETGRASGNPPLRSGAYDLFYDVSRGVPAPKTETLNAALESVALTLRSHATGTNSSQP